MTNRPYTDCDSLIEAKVNLIFTAYEKNNLEEHKKTRQKLDDLEKLVLSLKSVNYHDVIQYVAILGIIFISLILR